MTKLMRPDEELIELLWQDGHVIMHKQSCKRGMEIEGDERDPASTIARSNQNPNESIPEDGIESWLPYNLDDTPERDLCSEFLFGMPSTGRVDTNGLGNHGTIEGAGIAEIMPTQVMNAFQGVPFTVGNTIPKSHEIIMHTHEAQTNANVYMNTSLSSMVTRLKNLQSNTETAGNSRRKDLGRSSSMSSNCGSNHFVIPYDPGQALVNNASSSREFTITRTTSTGLKGQDATPTITSSSGGSGSSIGRAIHQNCSREMQKRKQMDSEETEFLSEDGEDYSMEPSKQQQRSSSSTRRSRSAEVHNLSERKRRDRINEKLKTLQDLIPHCRKADKVSVLDEAIEYLKSLQMQVQFMWMGSGMARMMLPNLQHYYSSLGMANGSTMLPIPGPIQMPAVPMFNQSTSTANAMNQTGGSQLLPPTGLTINAAQMQNLTIPEVYARFLGINQMQPPANI